jgi:hypothetical protein
MDNVYVPAFKFIVENGSESAALGEPLSVNVDLSFCYVKNEPVLSELA